MERYHLYLDESESHNNGSNRVFCLAGIIIKEAAVESDLKPSLNQLKEQIWSDYPTPTDIVLHEKDVRAAQNTRNSISTIKNEFQRFRRGQYSRSLYDGLDDIINTIPCKVIGAVVKMDDLQAHFNENIVTHNYLIAMQIILENYCKFLSEADGKGYVFYESRDDDPDSKVRMHYNHVKAMGSMYVNPYAMQKRLGEIEFPGKTENNPGLQIADFVPNNFARKALSKRHHRFNIYQTLRRSRYDGGLLKHDRFGIKIMP